MYVPRFVFVWARARSLCSLAPHASGPRDVPRCGALSLLQKTPHYRGVGEIAARLNVKLCDLTGFGWWHLTAISPSPLSTRKLKADEERAVSQVE